MITQKIFRTGNSVAVTIPKQYLEDLNFHEGTQVVVEKRGEELVLSSKKSKLAPDVDAKFMKMVDEFMDEHEDVLQELSQR